jgi:hypothetical protein
MIPEQRLQSNSKKGAPRLERRQTARYNICVVLVLWKGNKE